jgi:biopolymer transport protein ExbB/TolQ
MNNRLIICFMACFIFVMGIVFSAPLNMISLVSIFCILIIILLYYMMHVTSRINWETLILKVKVNILERQNQQLKNWSDFEKKMREGLEQAYDEYTKNDLNLIINYTNTIEKLELENRKLKDRIKNETYH